MRSGWLVLAGLLAGCGGTSLASGELVGDEPVTECAPVGDELAADSTYELRMGEWFIEAPERVTGGVSRFEITNDGQIGHEIAILRVDADMSLPVGADGGLDEAALPEGSLVGEVEPFFGGTSCRGTFELEPGEYAFLCALVGQRGGNRSGHWGNGMLAGFSVE